MAKKFREGESVEFKRDTRHGRDWEPGIYVREDTSFGPRSVWHWVLSARGFPDRFYVPARRIRKAE